MLPDGQFFGLVLRKNLPISADFSYKLITFAPVILLLSRELRICRTNPQQDFSPWTSILSFSYSSVKTLLWHGGIFPSVWANVFLFRNRNTIFLSLREVLRIIAIDNQIYTRFSETIRKTRQHDFKTNYACPVNFLILFEAYFHFFSYLCTLKTSLKERVTD